VAHVDGGIEELEGGDFDFSSIAGGIVTIRSWTLIYNVLGLLVVGEWRLCFRRLG
jgi:hypothetical protein